MQTDSYKRYKIKLTHLTKNQDSGENIKENQLYHYCLRVNRLNTEIIYFTNHSIADR